MSFLKDLVTRSRAKVRKSINCLLGDTHDHYTSFYPGNQSYIIRKIITRLVRKVPLDDHNIEKIQGIAPDSIVVYTCKNKRFFDFLYFHTRMQAQELPFPELAFDLRFFFLLPVKRVCRIILAQMDHLLHHF
ncbi:MAG TPA: glycerol-3-phosphate acyltransferase, partial [Desulfobacteraceae bacterium]|nr:glycerol-3-phosphate acyltransferase [Desulfobacteraceae bacterium]